MRLLAKTTNIRAVIRVLAWLFSFGEFCTGILSSKALKRPEFPLDFSLFHKSEFQWNLMFHALTHFTLSFFLSIDIVGSHRVFEKITEGET